MSPDDSIGPNDLDAIPGAMTQEAVLRTVAYADVFDFPLSRDEIVRFCLAPAGRSREVHAAIGMLIAVGSLQANQQYVFLPGRHDTVLTRRRRAVCSERAWSSARSWGRVIWAMPFVRMVAVTGSLAVNSMEAHQDIDYFIVVQPGRLWLVRVLCFALAFLAFLMGDRICPNYALTTNELVLSERNLYTARELAQMVPLHGAEMADRLWSDNRWVRSFIPNAELDRSKISDGQSLRARVLKRVVEHMLSGPVADQLEACTHVLMGTALAWLANRRHRARIGYRGTLRTVGDVDAHESLFSVDVCKFHTCEHNDRVFALYTKRLASLRHGDEYWTAPFSEDMAAVG